MKITVINGTEKHGVTYHLKEEFLKGFPGATVTEYHLPKDCPNFCMGCVSCVLRGEKQCKDMEYIQKIDASFKEADLLVFTSPAYVAHTTGAMKTLLDHFAYRWMPHRPMKEMFRKHAVIITQSLGAGEKSAAKDIADSLSWWGVTDIKKISFKLMSEINWDKLPQKRKSKMLSALSCLAAKLQKRATKPAKVGLVAKLKFYVVRMMQKSFGKKDPEYTDFKYWKQNGWIDKVRPWKD